MARDREKEREKLFSTKLMMIITGYHTYIMKKIRHINRGLTPLPVIAIDFGKYPRNKE